MATSHASGAVAQRTAWAKVNLTLQVTGRRADGYHELDSLIVFAGLGDELQVTSGPDLALEIEGPFAGMLGTGRMAKHARADVPENLILAAARALGARFDVAAGARLKLIKRLPVAAGLGGGSADAAAALRGLAELWNLDATEDELNALAARLGADVPVCLAGRPCFVSGIGDVISPAPFLPPAWLVLVNPGARLSTGRIRVVAVEFVGSTAMPTGSVPGESTSPVCAFVRVMRAETSVVPSLSVMVVSESGSGTKCRLPALMSAIKTSWPRVTAAPPSSRDPENGSWVIRTLVWLSPASTSAKLKLATVKM